MTQLHVPTFTSQTDMIGFLRALPANANYAKMVGDFGYVPPEDAPAHTLEYFFKYLVQGQYKGLTGADLEKYAVEGVAKHAKVFPWLVNPETTVKPVATPEKKAAGVRSKNEVTDVETFGEVTVFFNKSRTKWEAKVGNKLVSSCNTKDAVFKKLASLGIKV